MSDDGNKGVELGGVLEEAPKTEYDKYIYAEIGPLRSEGWETFRIKKRLYTIIHEFVDRIVELEKNVAGLKDCIRDHEEDCAVLPENFSVTETVNSLRNQVAELKKRLEVAEGRY